MTVVSTLRRARRTVPLRKSESSRKRTKCRKKKLTGRLKKCRFNVHLAKYSFQICKNLYVFSHLSFATWSREECSRCCERPKIPFYFLNLFFFFICFKPHEDDERRKKNPTQDEQMRRKIQMKYKWKCGEWIRAFVCLSHTPDSVTRINQRQNK